MSHPSSIEVNRRARRAKTDRIDLERIMRAFLAHLRGEPRRLQPRACAERRRRKTRSARTANATAWSKERTAHTNRIKALLHAQGIRDAAPLARGFLKELAGLHTGDGRELPPRLLAEIGREHERLVLVDQQIVAIEAANRAECRAAASAPPEATGAKMMRLTQLKAVGVVGAQVLANEVFYRRFANRRQVGACVGLTERPTAAARTSATKASARPAIGAPA